MTVGAEPSPNSVVICAQCGEQCQQKGRGNGDCFDGALLVLRTHDGRRVAIIGAEMEPPLNSACEACGQQTLIVAERVRVREIEDDGGKRLVRIVRRGTGAPGRW
jgi:hypothetical protein